MEIFQDPCSLSSAMELWWLLWARTSSEIRADLRALTLCVDTLRAHPATLGVPIHPPTTILCQVGHVTLTVIRHPSRPHPAIFKWLRGCDVPVELL